MSGRIVVITGGYGGLGCALARAFIAAGDRVVLTGRDETRLATAAAELGVWMYRALDVTDRQAVASLREHLQVACGHVDVLINNAGRMGGGGPLEDVDPDEFAAIMDANINGPFLVTRGLLPLLVASSAGLVINVASTSGHRADAHSAAYNASKFGLLGFTEAIRKDLRQRGIRVSSLSPSSISFSDDAPRGGKGARLHGDDVAAAAVWLADAPPRALVRDIELWATNP
ncbi:MAG: SDR family oxidoreductase [Planctomycetota bacterium]|jgi:3-oxoacyl-[acyl-carrier protein] reductase|nr:SDR family oxidoreductase [Planctomycetota bacterium]